MESKVYSGLSTIGNVQTIYTSIIAIFFIIVFGGVGIYLVRTKSEFSSKYTTNGIALDDSTCSRSNGGNNNYNNSVVSCLTNYSYIVPGDKNIYKGMSDSGYNNKGQVLKVYYDPNDHGKSSLNLNYYNLIGWGLIGIAIFVFIIIMINAYMTYNYKPYAAYEGAQGIFDYIFPQTNYY